MKNNLTATSSISSKYQTVIPAPIRKELNIGKTRGLVWHIIQRGERPAAVVSLQPSDWARHLSGLGKRVWQGVDTGAYLKELRDSWQR